jgi:hypothetical protein
MFRSITFKIQTIYRIFVRICIFIPKNKCSCNDTKYSLVEKNGQTLDLTYSMSCLQSILSKESPSAKHPRELQSWTEEKFFNISTKEIFWGPFHLLFPFTVIFDDSEILCIFTITYSFFDFQMSFLHYTYYKGPVVVVVLP